VAICKTTLKLQIHAVAQLIRKQFNLKLQTKLQKVVAGLTVENEN